MIINIVPEVGSAWKRICTGSRFSLENFFICVSPCNAFTVKFSVRLCAISEFPVDSKSWTLARQTHCVHFSSWGSLTWSEVDVEQNVSTPPLACPVQRHWTSREDYRPEVRVLETFATLLIRSQKVVGEPGIPAQWVLFGDKWNTWSHDRVHFLKVSTLFFGGILASDALTLACLKSGFFRSGEILSSTVVLSDGD